MSNLSKSIRFILENYQDAVAKFTRPNKNLAVCRRLRTLEDSLGSFIRDEGFVTTSVKASWGVGDWNPTPWIAFLDERITTSTLRGFYPVYLFKADGTGLYLSIDLATGRHYGKPSKIQLKSLTEKARILGRIFRRLQIYGFSNIPPIDLATKKGIGVGFAAGSAIHKFYSTSELPDSRTLLEDLLLVLREYHRICSDNDPAELLQATVASEVETISNEIASIAKPRLLGQGRMRDSKVRFLIETHAMDKAIEYFDSLGWSVKDVHKNKPYDLLCIRENRYLMVEVKGTTLDGSEILVTPNEVKNAQTNPDDVALFICSNIELSTNDRGQLTTHGGSTKVLDPWHLEDSRLRPIGYSYNLIDK